MGILPRQAVLLIHGIGEQRPHETLRSFVRQAGPVGPSGIVPENASVYGAPDRVSGRLDTRKLKVSWDQQGIADGLQLGEEREKNTGIRTDFYECYWAPSFRDTSWRQVRSWAAALVIRRGREIDNARLRGPKAPVARWVHRVLLALVSSLVLFVGLSLGGSWILAVSVLGLTAVIFASTWLGPVSFVRSILIGSAVVAVTIFAALPGDVSEGWLGKLFIALISPVTASLASAFFVKGLGDAARYFDDRPDNVNETEAVRRLAVRMIGQLTDEIDPNTGRYRYDRLVVVGHSLGSVIAYDAVRHAWTERNRNMLFPVRGHTDQVSAVVRQVEMAAVKLADSSPDGSAEQDLGSRANRAECPSTPNLRDGYAKAQRDLFRLLRDGRPSRQGGGSKERWIVSDLVTLGSPLAYADFFLSRGTSDFDERVDQRLLPTCPPQFQKTGHGYVRFDTVKTNHSPRGSCLHQAAVFAPVEWTNLYFPHDYVGGPIAPLFGDGVRDIQLGKGNSWLGWFAWAYPHSSYWVLPKSRRVRKRVSEGVEQSIRHLRGLIEPLPILLILLKRNTPPLAEDEMLQLRGILCRHSEDTEGAAVRAEVRFLGHAAVGEREYLWFPAPSPLRVSAYLLDEVQSWPGDRGKVTLRTSYAD